MDAYDWLTSVPDRWMIGQCLREPEREWLAHVLRSWAGKSAAAPAVAGPAGADGAGRLAAEVS